MNHFFTCIKHKSSTQNIFTNSENTKINEEIKYDKNKEKNDNKEQQQLLLLKNDSNDSLYNLEVIDYPYSSNNNNDDTTVKMNSPCKDKNPKNFVDQITNETNTNLIIKEKENQNMKHSNAHFFQNPSDNSPDVIKNEDSVIENKTLLTNYYINFNLINLNNINKINNIPYQKQEKNDIYKKINDIENKSVDNKTEIKVEYPCPDIQNTQIFLNNSKTKFIQTILNKTSCLNEKVPKNYLKNLKNNQTISKNKTTEFKRKRKENIKLTKLIPINKPYIGKDENTSKALNTCNIYVNKSYNNIKEYKIYKGKLKNIMNKKVEHMNTNTIKRKITLNNNDNRTFQKIEQIKKKGKGISYIKNIAKSKRTSASNANFKSSLLNRINKELDTLRNILTTKDNKRIINKKIKNRNKMNKKIFTKLDMNPFITNNVYKK